MKFDATNAGFEMFNKAVANRDVPTDYYRGGIYEGRIYLMGDEPYRCAIAENKDGWGIYPLGRENNGEDGPRGPAFGLFFENIEEAFEHAKYLGA